MLVAANLKAKKLGGFPSHGMVLCASTAGALSFVDPPKGAKPGDAVALPGLANPPASEAQVDKKKLFGEGPAALRRPQRDLLLQGQAVRYQRGAVHGVRRATARRSAKFYTCITRVITVKERSAASMA